MKSPFLKFLFRFLFGLVLLATAFVIWFNYRTSLPLPVVSQNSPDYQRVQEGPDYYRIGNNWLRKNDYGLWEMYLEGAPYERGIIYGILAEELINEQEEVFVDQIRNMIPGESFLKWLKYFVGWFNRDIDQYVQAENLEEIYGISRSFSDQFDFIGSPYYRVLNYHAAHDIGHALTDLNIVGCTSFAVSNELSADSSLLIGRNFDFNMGDRFAENKLILFLKPDSGYAFSSVTWAGFTGVVSGMNEKGLTVTLNAAKSDIPTKAKTPISLLAREILQYAQNIEEATAIARKRETFVSESILIGSVADKRAIIIEKTPSKTDVYDSGNSLTVCANHYQSKSLADEPANLENIETTDSWYRFQRMEQLIGNYLPLEPGDGISLLRNYLGMDDRFIGYGNPKSINQLLAHHGIIFQPERHKFWVSANPYQMGAFVGYDLTKSFSPTPFPHDTNLVYPPDPFLSTKEYRNFEVFREYQRRISTYLMTGRELSLSEQEIAHFIASNPESYLPYFLLGDYFNNRKDYQKAITYYEQALTKETSSKKDKVQLTRKLEKARGEF